MVTYKGVKLVNYFPSSRKGPLTHFPLGEHKGERVEEVIRKNPHYVMWAVKEWLDLSPSQALLFEEVTGGGIIPDRYIKESPPKEDPPPEEKQENPPMGWLSWSPDGVEEVINPGDVIPNLEFDPMLTPDWWPSFKEECRGKTGPQRKEIFDRYRREELRENMKFWK